MIIFRQKTYSMESSTIEKLTQTLDRERIDSYDVDDGIDDEAVNITADLNKVRIYLPMEEFDYARFEIDDYVRKNMPGIRFRVEEDNYEELIILDFQAKLRFDQYLKLVKFLISQYDYCVILSREI